MFPLVEQELDRFEERLPHELTSPVEFIGSIGDELVTAGGKRLRPALAFLTGRLVGAEPEATMNVALAVELLHSASLLHDDLIDDADTRRGAEAAFRRYGNVVSVMSGDFMLAKVLGLLARTGHDGFTALMARTATAVCEGEVLQFQVASLADYSYENYDRIIVGKTAELLATACEGVAIIAGVPDEQRAALRSFGLAYGRAFQMRDDYLDLLGDPDELGKPVGGDLREGKATFAVLALLLDEGVPEASSVAADVVARRASEEGDVERVAELVRGGPAGAKALARIREEADAAVAALAAFPPSPARDALEALVQQEVGRVA